MDGFPWLDGRRTELPAYLLTRLSRFARTLPGMVDRRLLIYAMMNFYAKSLLA
jgi:hypothetical protein